jgi:hypothetical protein
VEQKNNKVVVISINTMIRKNYIQHLNYDLAFLVACRLTISPFYHQQLLPKMLQPQPRSAQQPQVFLTTFFFNLVALASYLLPLITSCHHQKVPLPSKKQTALTDTPKIECRH